MLWFAAIGIVLLIGLFLGSAALTLYDVTSERIKARNWRFRLRDLLHSITIMAIAFGLMAYALRK
jgi:hypothetical protein